MTASTTDRHAIIGRHRYRAMVSVQRADRATADGVAAVDEVEEWFDDLTAAGRWVDANAGDFDGRVDQYVWAETVTIDPDADTVVYDATPVRTGRFVDRTWIQAVDRTAQPTWSHIWEPDDPTTFDATSLESLDGSDDAEWELDDTTLDLRKVAAPSSADLADAHRLLVEALRAAWQVCEAAERHTLATGPHLAARARAGTNLPEFLRGALEVVAAEVGGPDALVKHRPGSWEAEHVLALGHVWRFSDVA